MREQDFVSHAKIFKALSEETRLYILSVLQKQELCASELLKMVSIGQPTLSHHMKILCEAGLVQPRRNGKWTYYSLHNEGCAQARSMFENSLPSWNKEAVPQLQEGTMPQYLL